MRELTRRPRTRVSSLAAVAAILTCAPATLGQTSGTLTDKPSAPLYRGLTRQEGRRIVRAAWAHEGSESNVQDCSHVVHDIYRAAGYDYPYAPSNDVYRGTPSFMRVKYAHPGDLIAWPGHVGIVLNAKEHSFYSLVSTGFEAQNYAGAYWRGRGQPRFYRFVLKRVSQQKSYATNLHAEKAHVVISTDSRASLRAVPNAPASASTPD